jgi:AcrR family transcriptional regulator
MKVTETIPRRYRGTLMDERRTQRRCQLIAAAVKVYGEKGYRQSSVKSVCEAAGLTERYFYESFANSEALLAACLSTVSTQLSAALERVGNATYASKEAQTRAMLLAYFLALKNDPQSAKVFLLEIHGVSAGVDMAFADSLKSFGQGLACILSPAGTAVSDILQAGVTGGVMHIALHWLAEDFQTHEWEVVDAAWKLCSVLRPTV